MANFRERLLVAAGTFLLLGVGAAASSGAHTALWRVAALGLLIVSVAGYAVFERVGWLSESYGSDLEIVDGPLEPSDPRNRTVRSMVLAASTLSISIAYVALTGGIESPFFFVLYYPLMLLSYRYGARTGVIASLIFSVAYLYGPNYNPWRLTATHVAEAISFPCMAVFAGAVTTRLRRTARHLAQANSELDTLMDLSRMLETAIDLRTTVDLILLNAPPAVPFSTCAIYLTDPQDDVLKLADYMPRRARRNLLPAITLDAGLRERLRDSAGRDLAFNRDASKPSCAANGEIPATEMDILPLAPPEAGREFKPVFFDPDAGSVMYAPMHGSDGLAGLLCYARRATGSAFSTQECATIRRFAAHVGLIVQQALYRDRLELLAFQDVMTGLANYRYFERRLSEELSRCERYRHSLTVIMLDIDRFKDFNDTYGHKAGNALLAQFGIILRNTLREADLPARYGGEEFVIVCPETNAGQAVQIAERLREAIATNIFVLPGDLSGDVRTTSITASLGYATYPTDARTADALARLADQALYAAKAAGRNRVCHGAPADKGDDPAVRVNG